ncbi:MAG: substrate-binding domain-containing protein [Anaerolineales bacterium]
MSLQEKDKENMSRRNFLKIAATAAGGGVLAGCAPKAAEPVEPVAVEAPVEAAPAPETTVVPKYDLDVDTAYSLTMEKHSWLDWYHNAPKIHEYLKEPPFRVGYITSWRGDMWQEVNIAEAFREARRSELISELVHMDSAGSVDTEINNLKSMFTMFKAGDLHGIIVDPLDAFALVDSIEEIYDAGCPITLFNNGAETTKYTSFVSDDPWTFGTQGAEWLANTLNGTGKILFFRGLKGYPIDNARSGGALSVLENYPDIEIAAIDYGDWSYDKAKQLFTDMVAAHPQFDGIYSVGGQMSEAIIDAMVEMGMDPGKYAHGSEDENGFLQKSLQYGFPAFASCHPSIISAISVRLMEMCLQGYPVPKAYFFPTPVISSEQFADFVRPDVPTGVFVFTPLTDDEINAAFEEAGIK